MVDYVHEVSIVMETQRTFILALTIHIHKIQDQVQSHNALHVHAETVVYLEIQNRYHVMQVDIVLMMVHFFFAQNLHTIHIEEVIKLKVVFHVLLDIFAMLLEFQHFSQFFIMQISYNLPPLTYIVVLLDTTAQHKHKVQYLALLGAIYQVWEEFLRIIVQAV